MEPTKAIRQERIAVGYGSNGPMASITFHGREPMLIWDKSVLETLIMDLLEVNSKWRRSIDGVVNAKHGTSRQTIKGVQDHDRQT